MERLFGVTELPSSNFPPRYNIAPTQDIAIVRMARAGHRKLEMVRWGLVPFWMKEKPKQPHINARAETVDRTPLFREAFAARRCLVPATGFFEWRGSGRGKQPFRILLKSREPFAFAGVWETARIGDERVHSAAIIVTDANELVAPLHDRMPVIVAPADYAAWLDPATPLGEAKALLRPFPAALMEAYPVSTIVNSHENDGEECIAPITLADRTLPGGSGRETQLDLPAGQGGRTEDRR
jgi:putative SOS response-associated peptidase YedK